MSFPLNVIFFSLIQAKKQASSNAPKRKFTYGEQREYETIEADIASLEQQIAQVEAEMEGAASDYIRLQALMDQKGELEQKLEEKTERWLYLEELAEQIAAQK